MTPCSRPPTRRGGSQRASSQNLFLHPIDDQDRWYRVHQLFRDLLAAELRDHEPALLPELHGRAASWYEANGMAESALEHAQAAGDAERAAALIGELMQPTWAVGRADTVMRWLQWLADEDLLALHPPVAVGGTFMYAMAGRPIEAERWADAVLGTTFDTPTLPDGSSMDALLAYLRAFLLPRRHRGHGRGCSGGVRRAQPRPPLPLVHALRRRASRSG